MAILEDLNKDLITALKGGDKVAAETIRFLVSEAKNKKIELMHDLTEDEFLAVVGKEVKRRKESIDVYEKANRQDLVDNEAAQLAVLEKYQREQMLESDVEKIVDEEIAKFEGVSKEFTGQLIGKVMARIPKGSVDGSIVARIVASKLS